MDCPDSRKIIEWQFAGQPIKRLIGADSYDTSSLPGQSYTTYSFAGTYANANSKIGSCQRLFNCSASFTGKYRGIVSFYDSALGNDVFAVEYEEASGAIKQSKILGASGVLLAIDSCTSFNRTQRWALKEQGVTITSLVRADGQEDTGGGCILAIYKDGREVYKESAEECPVMIREYCESMCPPDTCECVRGSTVCCHDSRTGKVVKQFKRQ